ncbi:hypothetical protein P152DRAFT_390075 [Eremomyces bilateralis CBS 781.70]|uniref:BZIP domain-containing protein n=1 Tax=Eremomyces bilateralis CBS 781.70 TaxID=1392243 RepID=A0A6G1GD77_9PEZI|nr:uncharacterized protein P152DRAFT_390075 [Eremomyces bilateralis CBS 781.70]KAF1815851.1 hypothetical protein P152DRAFT_390075 [Eremomyces bilateralis CBS 781.70]
MAVSEASSTDSSQKVNDAAERRREQNKMAQRRFRQRAKEARDEMERDKQNQERAGASYSAPESSELDQPSNLEGLPWGGISMQHVIQTGVEREKLSQAGSQDTAAPMAGTPQAGSSSQ